MGNDQNIILIHLAKCKKAKCHNFYARNDSIEDALEEFKWDNLAYREAFYKAGLALDMYKDSIECAEDHLSVILCQDCQEILAVVAHYY